MVYVEFPFDRIVGIHGKTKPDGPPPDGGVEDDCFAGTWEYSVDRSLDGVSRLEIHDVLTVKNNGIPGDRTFSSPPANYNIFRVVGPQDVEFGPINPGLPNPYEKNLYGRSLLRPGSVLIIEGETVPSSGGGPPPIPPAPFWPGGWIPKFSGGSPSTPTLSFSATKQYSIMPPYPDHSFMTRSGSWSYTYSLWLPSAPIEYPCFDPDIAPGGGVFYLTEEGGSPPSFSGPYQEWWDWAYGGEGTIDNWPGWYGDQFYTNIGSTGGSFRLKLTQRCGPWDHPRP